MTTAIFHKDTELAVIKENISIIEKNLEEFTEAFDRPFFAIKGWFKKREVEYERTGYAYDSATRSLTNRLEHLRLLESFVGSSKSFELNLEDYQTIHNPVILIPLEKASEFIGIEKGEDEDYYFSGYFIKGAYTKDT